MIYYLEVGTSSHGRLMPYLKVEKTKPNRETITSVEFPNITWLIFRQQSMQCSSHHNNPKEKKVIPEANAGQSQ